MSLNNEDFIRGNQLDDDDLDCVSGGIQGPASLQPPTQPQPSRPSIPRDPGLPKATPTPSPLELMGKPQPLQEN